jgi:hypothetical protein
MLGEARLPYMAYSTQAGRLPVQFLPSPLFFRLIWRRDFLFALLSYATNEISAFYVRITTKVIALDSMNKVLFGCGILLADWPVVITKCLKAFRNVLGRLRLRGILVGLIKSDSPNPVFDNRDQ